MRIQGPSPISGELTVPADKSVSHRALIFAALAEGESTIEGLLESKDVLSTAGCLQSLGVAIERRGAGSWRVAGRGARGFVEAAQVLDCGNSGTTARLMLGVLSALPLTSTFTGDRYLCARPMARVVEPLVRAGARVMGRGGDALLPLTLRGGSLKPLDFQMPVASAQLKSCLLLAALSSEGTWRVTEPAPTRDHTERMLAGAGVKLQRDGLTVSLTGPQAPRPQAMRVVGDISSAAFWIAAGLLAADGELVLSGVNTNPTRTGILDVVRAMGGHLVVEEGAPVSGEPQGRLRMRRSELVGTRIAGDLIPRLIDELPVIAVMACFARGVTEIRDATELRKKECDRIKALCAELPKLGAQVREEPDGLTITGTGRLTGAVVDSHEDHRIAMALAIAALAAHGSTTIERAHCVDISYPEFWRDLARVAPRAIDPGPDPHMS